MSNIMNANVEETVVSATPQEIAEYRAEPTMGISVSELANPQETAMFCSLKSDGSLASKARIFNAVNSPDKKIADCIGETIQLTDIVAHPIWLTDENTGETIEAMRMVLVDDKGISYEAVSGGLVNAVQRILQIFGQPDTWETPIPVKPIQKGTRNGNNKVTTLKIEA